MDKIDLRYQRGKIYTIRCYDDDTLIYVGSTIETLSARMSKHRSHKCSLCEYVNGNWKNWYIELYEEYPCNNKQLLEKREGEIIRLIGNINKNIAGRTYKEYRDDNKEEIAEYFKKYREANKEKLKKYREDHKEYFKNYNENNKEKLAEQRKTYRDNNKEKMVELIKKWREDNKQIIREKKREKVICNHCGCEITNSHLKRHQKTNKCINFVK